MSVPDVTIIIILSLILGSVGMTTALRRSRTVKHSIRELNILFTDSSRSVYLEAEKVILGDEWIQVVIQCTDSKTFMLFKHENVKEITYSVVEEP